MNNRRKRIFGYLEKPKLDHFVRVMRTPRNHGKLAAAIL